MIYLKRLKSNRYNLNKKYIINIMATHPKNNEYVLKWRQLNRRCCPLKKPKIPSVSEDNYLRKPSGNSSARPGRLQGRTGSCRSWAFFRNSGSRKRKKCVYGRTPPPQNLYFLPVAFGLMSNGPAIHGHRFNINVTTFSGRSRHEGLESYWSTHDIVEMRYP